MSTKTCNKEWKIAKLLPTTSAIPMQVESPVHYDTCDQRIHNGYGKCSECSCPGFVGSGNTCSRSGCGHHYDSHW